MAASQENTLPARIAGLAQLPAQQMVALMLAVAISVTLVAGAWMWSNAPDYRVLYANLADRDGGAVIAALQQMNIPYKFADGGGAVMVPAGKVHEARLKLASQGLPKSGQAGFELMENQKFGTSQFLEQINYQRGLEGELVRSIQSLSAVQSARVHLALAKPSAFLREQPKPSASVLLNLHPGRQLDAMQVAAITHLVSNSVPGMPMKNVSVVDQTGALLSGDNAPTGKAALDPGQIKYRLDLEAGYARRIEAIVAPLIGANNVRAQVAIDLDFTETEQADETYKPNQKSEEAAIRSQQSSEASTPAVQAGAVPGALSNQPPAAPSAPVNPPPAAAATGSAASGTATTPPAVRKDSTVNYEVDKTIRHTRQATGRVKKVSVAVVVNHRKVTDASGKSTNRPLSENDRKQITELVKGVVGFDSERGDTLSIMNSVFAAPDVEKPVDVPFWKQSATYDIAWAVIKNLLIAGVVLYLVLGVMRPLLKTLSTPVERPPEVQPPQQLQMSMSQASAPYESQLQSAKQLVKQDPKMVASVVKDWVAGNEQ